MADIIQLIKDEWHVVNPAKWVLLAVAVAAAGLGWWFADYHYSGRIEALKETLDTKEFPRPVIKTVTVAVKDAKQTELIAALQGALDEANRLLGSHPPVTPAPTAAHPRLHGGHRGASANSSPPALSGPASQTTGVGSSTNQSGGVVQGVGGTIGTYNQNGLPARSAFAKPLGDLYTEGYLILQQAFVSGITNDQEGDLEKAFAKWRAKAVDFMNANMCSDAAAYFLKAHRAGMTYGGMSQAQNNLADALSWTLDNVSDLKRNDAWDCK